MSKAYVASFVKKTGKNRFFVLDTETTKIKNGEIVQIGILNSEGEILLDTLVKPTLPIPAAATAIHKITNQMVVAAPSWAEVAPKVAEIVTGQYVVIYNTSFDVGVMASSDRHLGIKTADWFNEPAKEWLCAMRAFSSHYGEWNNYRKSYAWKPLSFAAAHMKVPVADAHSAIGDCRMTLGVVNGLVKHYAEKGKADA
jgi:DNA polymerase-3 subunit epsilon